MGPVVQAIEALKKVQKELEDLEAIIADKTADKEMREMAEAELHELKTKLPPRSCAGATSGRPRPASLPCVPSSKPSARPCSKPFRATAPRRRRAFSSTACCTGPR
jgi:hypothetical protein